MDHLLPGTGNPAKGAPDWPAYNLKNRPMMRIDTKCTVIDNRYAEELKMWRDRKVIKD